MHLLLTLEWNFMVDLALDGLLALVVLVLGLVASKTWALRGLVVLPCLGGLMSGSVETAGWFFLTSLVTGLVFWSEWRNQSTELETTAEPLWRTVCRYIWALLLMGLLVYWGASRSSFYLATGPVTVILSALFIVILRRDLFWTLMAVYLLLFACEWNAALSRWPRLDVGLFVLIQAGFMVVGRWLHRRWLHVREHHPEVEFNTLKF